MKGRPPDPNRARRGTGHRPQPGEGPVVSIVPDPPAVEGPAVEGPQPPEGFPAAMLPTWDRLIEALDGAPLRAGDAMAIEMMVRFYTRVQTAGALVDQYGVIQRKETGDITAAPFVKIERDSAAMFLRFAEHYGLTMAARMRLGLMRLAGQTMAQALSDDLNR